MMNHTNASSSSTSLDTAVSLGTSQIRQILQASKNALLVQRHIVSGVHGFYVLFIGPTSEPARLSTEEGITRVSEYLKENNSVDHPLALTFTDFDTDKLEVRRFAIVFKITQKTMCTLEFSLEEERMIQDYSLGCPLSIPQSLYSKIMSKLPGKRTKPLYLPLVKSRHERSDRKSCRPMLLWAIVASLLLGLMIIFGLQSHRHASRPKIWVRYDIRGSKGPKYQLQFTHHNVSDWDTPEKQHRYTSNSEWALRIDDQAMIPMHLLTAEEERYQTWFRARYPEKELIRQQQLYLNQSFLSDPYAIQVLSDESFHTAHCVLALRRYWWAKESGMHVCPRDIDYRHIKHCLDSLDELAFPSGERGPVVHDPEPANIRLLWESKVCF